MKMFPLLVFGCHFPLNYVLEKQRKSRNEDVHTTRMTGSPTSNVEQCFTWAPGPGGMIEFDRGFHGFSTTNGPLIILWYGTIFKVASVDSLRCQNRRKFRLSSGLRT